MRDYFTDVENYSKENAEALLAFYAPIEVSNTKLEETEVLTKAYQYAKKQLEKEGT
jgi:hypothetical protein